MAGFSTTAFFRSRYVLGKSAATIRVDIAEYLVTWSKLLDFYPDRFNLTRYVESEYRVFGFEKPSRQADQERIGSKVMPVCPIYGCRTDFYQYFILLRDRRFNFFEPKNLRWSVSFIDHCFHAGLLPYLPVSTSMFIVMFHRDDYISLFVSTFDIAVSLDNLF